MNGDDHARVGLGVGIAVAYAAVHSFGVNLLLGGLIIPISWLSAKLPDIDHDKTKIGRKRKVITNLSSNLLTAIIIGGIFLCGGLTIATGMQLVNSDINSTEASIAFAGLITFALLRKVIGSSDIVQWAKKHRGLMHTLIVPTLLYLATDALPSVIIQTILIGINTGYISHLFADTLTKDGCPLLFPLTKKPIHILNLTTSDYKTDKRGRRVKKKFDECKIASYIVAVASVFISITIF